MWRTNALRIPSGGAAALRVLRASIAPFLLLVTPVAIFVQHHRHGFSNPDVLLFVLVLAGLALLAGIAAAASPALEVIVIAGLLTLFADVQLEEPGEKRLLAGFLALCILLWLLRQHAARIVSVAMAAVLASSLLPRRSEAGPAGMRPAAEAREDLPLVVHLVLDEHIGVDGLPAEPGADLVRRELESFFVGRGFRLFERAYSEHANTVSSLGQLLNLAPGRPRPELAAPTGTGATFRLTRSAYFDRLAGRGYALRVYQSEYLEMCTYGGPVEACQTYRPSSIEALDALAVPAAQKVPVIAGAILARSELHVRAKRTYRAARARMLAANMAVPDWDWERFAPAPLGTMPVFETVAGDASRARGGTVLFAHLLMPHDPYVYTSACDARPPGAWVTRGDATRAIVPGGVARSQSRAARYRLYFDQVRCAQRKVAQVLDAIPLPLRARAIVIVQGDHGSRIGEREPTAVEAERLTSSDYADHFSTLFAVRAPGIPAGTDANAAPIACLLRALVEGEFRALNAVDACSAPQIVYLEAAPAPVPRRLPAFWRPGSEAPRTAPVVRE